MKLPGFTSQVGTGMPTIRPAIQSAPPKIQARQVNYIPEQTVSQTLSAGLREADKWNDVVKFGATIGALGNRITEHYNTQKANQAVSTYTNVMERAVADRILSPEYNNPKEVPDRHGGSTYTVRPYESMDQDIQGVRAELEAQLEADGLLDSKLSRRLFEEKKNKLDLAIDLKVQEHVVKTKLEQIEATTVKLLADARSHDEVDAATDAFVAAGGSDVKAAKWNVTGKQKVNYDEMSIRIDNMAKMAEDIYAGGGVAELLENEMTSLQEMIENPQNYGISFEQGKQLRGRLQTMLQAEYGEIRRDRGDRYTKDWRARFNSSVPGESEKAAAEASENGFLTMVGEHNRPSVLYDLARREQGETGSGVYVDDVRVAIAQVKAGARQDYTYVEDLLSRMGATNTERILLQEKYLAAKAHALSVQSTIVSEVSQKAWADYGKERLDPDQAMRKIREYRESFELYRASVPNLTMPQALDRFVQRDMKTGLVQLQQRYWVDADGKPVTDWKNIAVDKVNEMIGLYSNEVLIETSLTTWPPGPNRVADKPLPPEIDQNSPTAELELNDYKNEMRGKMAWLRTFQKHWEDTVVPYAEQIEIERSTRQGMGQL